MTNPYLGMNPQISLSLLLVLTPSYWPCLQHSRNLGPAFYCIADYMTDLPKLSVSEESSTAADSATAR